MTSNIDTITLPLPLRMGSVNCYLLNAPPGHILIDTGAPNARRLLRRQLERRGCPADGLTLIILTHGDFDHTGNAAALRRESGARIAMHREDAAAGDLGDMFANRKRKPSPLVRRLMPALIGFGRAERFVPDVWLEDGTDLGPFGVEARVYWLPGHSPGSIGVLTSDGHLICGDLLVNAGKPAVNSLTDDLPAAKRSVLRLKGLPVEVVHPGHGRSFAGDELRALAV